jgi:hypothetical protein
MHITDDLGPRLDGTAVAPMAPHDHEITLTTATQRITLRDGDPPTVETAPPDDPAQRVVSADGTWGVEIDYHNGVIVAGPVVDGQVVRPVTIHGKGPLIRYVAGSGVQRTVVLDRSNWGWYLEQSADGGSTWNETRLFIAGSSVATSRDSFDLVTRDGDWIRIHRDGAVATTPAVHVVPDSSACASTILWVPLGKQLEWFDRTTHGSLRAGVRDKLACSGTAVLAMVDGGLTRCTPAGCDAAVERGDFADLASDGVVTATQHGKTVQLLRAKHTPTSLQLADGERVVAMAVWRDVPTLVVLGANKRLHFASPQ